jgi:hypothetical protein
MTEQPQDPPPFEKPEGSFVDAERTQPEEPSVTDPEAEAESAEASGAG